MRSMTRKERRLFERLVRLAGTPVLVEEALRETSREFDGPTPLERVVRPSSWDGPRREDRCP